MASSTAAGETATAPLATSEEPIYQTPEWETPTARPKRRSLLRLLPATDADAPASTASVQMVEQHRDVEAAVSKEGHAPAAREGVAVQPSHEPTAAAAAAGGISGRPTMRQRLDRVLPPYRTYFGRSRRFLLLFIMLPLAILLLVVLPLAVGLGVGLSRHKGNSSSDLPLPSNTETFTGDLTYYSPGLGACGVTSTSENDIVSVSHIIFDAASTSGNPNANPLCGKKIRIKRSKGASGNNSVDVTVVDRCTGCAATDLDVSLGVFTQLADEADGRVQTSWAWLS